MNELLTEIIFDDPGISVPVTFRQRIEDSGARSILVVWPGDNPGDLNELKIEFGSVRGTRGIGNIELNGETMFDRFRESGFCFCGEPIPPATAEEPQNFTVDPAVFDAIRKASESSADAAPGDPDQKSEG